MRNESKLVASIVTGFVALLGFIAVIDSYTVIQPGYVGVLFNRWTGSLRVESQGMVWMLPFVTTVQKYPVALRTYSMVQKSGEGSSTGDDSIDLPTKEGQHIKQDISVTFNTTDAKAAEVFKSFNGADVETIESTFIRRTIITNAQNVAGQMSLTDLISGQRGKLQEAIQVALVSELSKMGFTVDKVNLGASHLPAAIEAQMQTKMAAQQNAQQAEYELQKQVTMAKAKVAEAEGDAQAALVKAQSLAKSNLLLQSTLTSNLIQAKAIEKWNGVLPQVSSGATPFINLSKVQ